MRGEGCGPRSKDAALFQLETTTAGLLSVGDAHGRLSPEGARRLREIGEEMRHHVLVLRELLTAR